MVQIKDSLTKKLTRKISFIILIILIVLNLLYLFLSTQQSIHQNKASFINQSSAIAQTISETLNEEDRPRMGNRHNMIERQYNNLLSNLSNSSIYLYNQENQKISQNSPQNDPSNLFSSESNYQQIKHSLFSYQQQVLLDIPNTQYKGLFESPIISLFNASPVLIISSLFSLLLAYLITRTIASKITQPITQITEITQQYRKENYKPRSSINQNDEIGLLSQAINQFGHELQEAKIHKEQEESIQREFIATLSHELKTPLSIIELSLENFDPNNPNTIENIKQESNHLKHLVNDLIDLTKLEHPEFKLEHKPVSIHDIINDVSRSLRIKVNKNNLNLVSHLTTPINIQGDYVRLRQLFFIILDNAIKFSRNKIEINQLAFNTLSIKDDGLGLSPENLNKIFDRYFQVEKTRTQGSGLGLSIAKEIANRHNITIDVKSEINKYTEFILTFNEFSLEHKSLSSQKD